MAARAGAHVKRGIVLALQVQFVVVSGKQMVNLGLSDPRGVGLLHALQVGPKLFGVIAGLKVAGRTVASADQEVASPTVVWFIPISVRRTRSRAPTCTSTGLGIPVPRP